jgi:hypothetical protein
VHCKKHDRGTEVRTQTDDPGALPYAGMTRIRFQGFLSACPLADAPSVNAFSQTKGYRT